jgi:hypothetical protein
MIVTLDGQRMERQFASTCTLENVIDEVRAGLGERLVVSVSLNGHVLSDAELDSQSAGVVTESAQVDVQTSSPVELVHNVLLGLASSFDEAGTGLPDIADALGGSDSTAAVRDVANIITLWQTCYRALAQCSGLLQRDLTQTQAAGRPVKDHLIELIGKLTELRAALETRDMVALADVVRYELPLLAQLWSQVLTGMAEQIAA